MKYFGRGGREDTDQFVKIAIFILVLIILVFGIIFLIKGPKNFFSFLPDFKTNSEIIEDVSVIGYDVVNNKVQYFDGTKWGDLQGAIKIDGIDIEASELRKDFDNYIISSKGIKFNDHLNRPTEVLSADLEEFHIQIQTGEYFPVIIKHNGENYRYNEGDVGIKDVGNFMIDTQKTLWKYYIVIDDSVLVNKEYRVASFIRHLSNIDILYLESVEIGNRLYRVGKELFIRSGFENSLEFNSGDYRLDDNNQLEFKGAKLGIFFEFDSDGYPSSISVKKKDLILEKMSGSNFDGMRKTLNSAVYSRPISIASNYYCIFAFRDGRMIIRLQDEASANSECKEVNLG